MRPKIVRERERKKREIETEEKVKVNTNILCVNVDPFVVFCITRYSVRFVFVIDR